MCPICNVLLQNCFKTVYECKSSYNVRMYELEGASSARATNWQNLANDMPTRGNRVNAWCFVPQKCERNDEEEPVVRGVK